MPSESSLAMRSEHGPATLSEHGPTMPSEYGAALPSEYGLGMLSELSAGLAPLGSALNHVPNGLIMSWSLSCCVPPATLPPHPHCCMSTCSSHCLRGG